MYIIEINYMAKIFMLKENLSKLDYVECIIRSFIYKDSIPKPVNVEVSNTDGDSFRNEVVVLNVTSLAIVKYTG